ncbi:MAG: 4Fe-4S binding protein [Bacillota bacterium]
MKCHYCGNRRSELYLYCPACGAEEGKEYQQPPRTFELYRTHRLPAQTLPEGKRDLFRDFIKMPVGNLWIVRILLPLGLLQADQLAAIGRLAREYGQGEVHWTTRQGLEIPGVPGEKVLDLQDELAALGLKTAPRGGTGRNVVCCPGQPTCTNGLAAVRELAQQLQQEFAGKQGYPHKFKIAISGCPNNCARAEAHDFGLIAVQQVRVEKEKCTACGLCARACKEKAITITAEGAVIDYSNCQECGMCLRACPAGAIIETARGYRALVGGNGGRHPRLGRLWRQLAQAEEIVDLIKEVQADWIAHGRTKERIGAYLIRKEQEGKANEQ